MGASDKNGNITLVEPLTGKLKPPLAGGNYSVAAIAFSADSRSLAVMGLVNPQVTIRDVETGQTKAVLPMSNDWLTCLAFSRDGRRLAVGGGRYRQPGQIKVFDLATNSEGRTFEIATNCVKSVTFSPGGKRLAAGGAADMNLFTRQRNSQWYVWDVETGDLIVSSECRPTSRIGLPRVSRPNHMIATHTSTMHSP